MASEGGIIPPLREGSGATHTAEVLVQAAWNMISIPVIPPDPTKTVLLPTAVSSAFVYLPPPSGYVNEDTLLPGAGFWVKFAGVQTLSFAGTGLTRDTITVNAGWNLIGTLTYPVLTGEIVPVGGLTVLSSYFSFLGGFGYTSEDTLRPGQAYWVKVDQPGYLVLEAGSVLIEPSAQAPLAGDLAPQPARAGGQVPGEAGTITFRDAAGQQRELYLAASAGEARPGAFELPPPPPGGIFDVRFASQRVLETFGAAGTASTGVRVSINGGSWPVEVGYSGGPGNAAVELSVVSQGGERLYDLRAGGVVRLDQPALLTVRARQGSASAGAVPAEYRLYQNHPNPFNPTTQVTFDLPEAAHVTLVLTNALGQAVRVVLDAGMDAGRHVVGIDGNGLPTGVYFYRLTAGNFSDARKMLLLK
jgi:hypothetical protein